MEELIKKSHDDYQDCIKRAVASEVRNVVLVYITLKKTLQNTNTC